MANSLFHTKECLVDVFDYLKYDIPTLYSCALVNRAWCRLVIPLLWSNPLDDFEFNSLLYPDKFLRTCIKCLDKEDKKLLFDQGIEDPWIMDCLNTDEKKEFFTSVLGNLFFEKTKGIKKLSIYEDSSSLFIDVTKFRNSEIALEGLEIFKIYHDGYSIEQKDQGAGIKNMFLNLLKFSNELKHIDIDIDYQSIHPELPGCIIDFIVKQQSKLITLSTNQFWRSNVITVLFYEGLLKISKTLKHIKISKFTKVQDFVTVLKYFENLQTLEFLTSVELRDDFISLPDKLNINNGNIVSIIELPKIKNLYYDMSHVSDILPQIIKIANFNLESLHLSRSLYGSGDSTQLFDTISNYCKNIKRLSIRIALTEIDKLVNVLMELKHMEVFNIEIKQHDNTIDNNDPDDYIIKSLSNCLNDYNHKLVSIGINFYSSVHKLKCFFDNCHKLDLKIISLYDKNSINPDNLKLLLDYKKNEIFTNLKEIRFQENYYKGTIELYNSIFFDAKRLNIKLEGCKEFCHPIYGKLLNH
nr:9782_t:CDS:2 [Entrophospora candida]